MGTEINLSRWIRGTMDNSKPAIPVVARYSTKGKTNQDSDRAILKDLSGNRHDISLKNFAYMGMSGYNGYNYDFLKWFPDPAVTYLTTPHKWIGNGTSRLDAEYILFTGVIVNCPPVKIIVSGLIGDSYIIYEYLDLEILKRFKIATNGEHTLPASTLNPLLRLTGFFGYNFTANKATVTIEQVPPYPDGLVFDGVDDCGVCNNLTIGNDYTVIAKRKYPDIISKSSVFLSKRGVPTTDNYGEFIIEKLNWDKNTYTYSYGGITNISSIFNASDIVIQTKNMYNKVVLLKVGSHEPNNLLLLGAGLINNAGSASEFSNVIFYDLIIYGRTLTEEEIQSEIKKYNL